MKTIVFIILALAICVVIYLTFFIALLKIAIGSIFLGIFALALLALGILWKKKTTD